MRLTFTYIIKPNKSQEKIIKELMWHSSKVYNMLNYDVKEGKEKINTNGILNVEGSRIYKKYRKENWHSEYLHSHMLQGLFKTNKGKIINADVNGSINILRKYIKNIFSPNLEIAMDIGREQRPLKKRVA